MGQTTPNPFTNMNLPFAPRRYQIEGATFLLRNDSALLADEMGLGKTMQTIIAIRALRDANLISRVIVVAPRSLCSNWQREFNTWAPDLPVRLNEGSWRNRQATYYLPVPVVIASYEQISADMELFDRDHPFDIVVLDEAQRIKREGSRTSVACRGIPRTRSWALTGTPLENRANDLITLFSFVRRTLLFRGIAVGDLHQRIQPYFMRRTKSQVAPELPPIVIQDYKLRLSGNQLCAYRELWSSRQQSLSNGEGSNEAGRMLALITRLKQLCNVDIPSGESAKLEALTVILESLTGPRDKVLLFSQYVTTLRWLSEQISGVPCKIFHGGLAGHERDETVQWFREQPGPSVMLMSLKAGGVGLNIPEASVVVLFDRWWNPAIEHQAIGRAHRLGRREPLHVIRFLVSETIEERIDMLQQEKQALFEEYVDGAQNAELSNAASGDLWNILGISQSEA